MGRGAEKLCHACGETKPRDQFAGHATGNIQPNCRECNRRLYREQKGEWDRLGLCTRCGGPRDLPGKTCDGCRRQGRKENGELLVAHKLRAVEFLGGACVDCGLRMPHLPVYEFHHLDREEKDADVAVLMPQKWERIEAELRKCVLLCANCHRIRHILEGYK